MSLNRYITTAAVTAPAGTSAAPAAGSRATGLGWVRQRRHLGWLRRVPAVLPAGHADRVSAENGSV